MEQFCIIESILFVALDIFSVSDAINHFETIKPFSSLLASFTTFSDIWVFRLKVREGKYCNSKKTIAKILCSLDTAAVFVPHKL
jgi:hypothetical protein